MEPKYSITIKEAEETIDQLIYSIKTNTTLPTDEFTYDTQTISSAVNKNPDDTYDMVIGTQPLYDRLKQGYVTDKDFVFTILSCFHEEQHVHQFERFQQPNPNKETRHFAHVDIIQKTFPESYLKYSTYWENAMEIDAELYAIKKTSMFVKENYPNIDVNGILVDMIQKANPWYANNKIRTIDDAIQNLETALDKSYTKPLALIIKTIHPKSYSPALKQFARDKDRKQAYVDAYAEGKGDGTVATNILLDFIREEYPWKYKNYPCLEDEWDDRIRTSKKPLFARIRGLDRKDKRMAELKSHFDKIMSSEYTEKDDKQFGD